MADNIRVKLIRSHSGRPQRHRATLKGLGLTKMHRVRELQDTPAIRGMIAKVAHMVQVVD